MDGSIFNALLNGRKTKGKLKGDVSSHFFNFQFLMQFSSLYKKLFIISTIFVICIAVINRQHVYAQTTEEIKNLQNMIEEMRKTQESLEKELREIKMILKGLIAPQQPSHGASSGATELTLAGRRFRGLSSAPVTLVEFSDYQCDYCSRYFLNTFSQIVSEYVEKGTVRYFFKNFPDQNLHPQSFKAHEAALCAGDQGQYWEMHDQLFTDPEALGMEDLIKHAMALGLDTEVFSECLESGKNAEIIYKDIAEARQGGVNGSPVFAIGLSGPDESSMKVMRVVAGAQPFSVFKDAIDFVLAASKKGQ